MLADFDLMTILWRNGLVAIPIALCVIVLCRAMPFRPSTRHALWLLVLASFIMPPALHTLWDPSELRPVEPASTATTLNETEPAPPIASTDRSDATTAQPKRAATPPKSTGTWTTLPRLSPMTTRPGQTLTGTDSRDRAGSEFRSETSRAASDDLHQPRPGHWDVISETPARAERPAPDAHRTTRTEQPDSIGSREREVANDDLIAATPLVTPNDASSTEPATARHWSVVFFQVRDALINAPPIPAWWWAGGVVMIALVLAVRTLRFRRVVGRAFPAPGDVQLCVIREAEALGLRESPRVLMVREALSPMVWCGRRATLLLPSRLWSDLDEDSRRAVIVHELAHLKRRDHWVCWAMLLIGALYWWHPLVWWLQRRLRDEADLSCDAWVTTLLPRARRAYAQALLTTRMFLTNDDVREAPRPAVGLGAISPRTRGFARRLTMVMTNQSAPTMSRGGLAVVLAAAISAGLSAPLWACPPEDKDKQDKPAKVIAPKAPKAPKAPAAPKAPKAPKTADEAESTFEQFMKEREGGDAMLQDEELRLKELEARLAAMQRRLERMVAGEAESIDEVRVLGRGENEHAIVIDGAEVVWAGPSMAAMGDNVVARKYVLPEGKLDALTQLMIRQDVPVLVEPRDDAIVVHATPRDHEIFAMFVKLIHPQAKVERREGPTAVIIEREARGQTPREADIRQMQDRVIEIQRAAEQEASGAQRDALRKAAEMRKIEMKKAMEAREKAIHEAQKHVKERLHEAHKQLDLHRETIERQLNDIEVHMTGLRSKAKQAEGADRKRIEVEIEALREHAKAMKDRREALHEHFEDLEDHMHDMLEELHESLGGEDFDFDFEFDFDVDHDSDHAHDHAHDHDSARSSAKDSDRATDRVRSSSSQRSSSSSSKSSSSSGGGRLQ